MAMRAYPNSFLKLLVVGLTLVALPLVAALITSAVAVDRLANLSQSAVYQAVQATQNSRRMLELVTAMERSARQLIILGDRTVLDAYRISRGQFDEIAGSFKSLPLDIEQRSALEEISRNEREIYATLADPDATPAALRAQVVRFVDLGARAQEIMTRSNQLIDREVEAMRATADRAQRIMLWQSFALIPVVIFLVAGFAILISRPIAQIDAAIRELGQGRFRTPVQVQGPDDLQQLGERLEWMRRQLYDIEQQKNRFLQQVAHELKTPLTALREGAQLLSDDVVGRLTPEQREIAEILRHNSIELQKRIEDLLDYGSIQFQKLKLDPVPVDPREVLERVAQSQRLAVQAKNISLQLKSAHVPIVADPEKLRVILDNLLSNAIRFAPDGGKVAVQMQSNAGSLMIDVLDDGPGIAPEDMPRIFEPFYQGRIPGSGPVKGSGLGLSIVREYVLAHGGSAEVIANAARGAHLRVRLPLAPALKQ